MSTQTIREYLNTVWKIYIKANRKLKGVILDEVSRNLGIHRKAAVRLMNRPYPPRSFQGFKGGRRRKYTDEAKDHLCRLWGMMGYMCASRMKAALPEWLVFDTLGSEAVKEELKAMSVSSINRFLERQRASLKRRMNTGTRRSVRAFVTEVPVRNLGEQPSEPGHCEVDCVAHCGGELSGEFVWSVNLTDIVTGWTECEAVWTKNAVEVRRALRAMERRLPFPIRGLYFDNGGEFMNDLIVNKFAKENRSNPLPIYRSRPYKKNDQCYVEQKNNTHIRKLFGYGRINWKKSVGMMNDLYRKEWRAIQNFYLPQHKLLEKYRIGAKIKKIIGHPKTPVDRLLCHIQDDQKQELLNEKQRWNPFITRHNQRRKIKSIFGYYKHTIDPQEWGKMAL